MLKALPLLETLAQVEHHSKSRADWLAFCVPCFETVHLQPHSALLTEVHDSVLPLFARVSALAQHTVTVVFWAQ